MDPVTPEPDIGRYMASDENPMADSARRRRAVWDSPDEMVERLKKGSPLAAWREDFLRAYVVYGTEAREDGTVEIRKVRRERGAFVWREFRHGVRVH